MTRVVIARPPNYNELAKAFPIANRSVIFSWGDVIYNPKGVFISPQLFAHEAAHQARQLAGVELWWQRYIADPEFRLREEILGHRAELQKLVDMGMNRQRRRHHVKEIAKRLASPVYGRLITRERALLEITS